MSDLIWQNMAYPGVNIEDVTDELILENIRFHRKAKLASSDWTQTEDAPVDKAAWAAYRQALRDLPKSGAPRDLVWPTPPAL